ncbi:hypothetical protein HZC09_04960 [Candidatus Micrarchaeota archaeon]|nr:hypothetical protein [Candidatus Micrarchaeota archaeon]
MIFVLEAFYALLGMLFIASLHFPPQPRMENLLALDAAFEFSNSMDAAKGFCYRATGPEAFQTCSAERWACVPRTVYSQGKFRVYGVCAGRK